LFWLGVLPALAIADDWPGWRGPSRQGVSAETGLPLHWSATENVAWKTVLPGEGWSSPIVWGERVFVTTATDGGASCHVLAFDRASGRPLWDTEVFRQGRDAKNEKNSDATATPATDGRRVYAVFPGGIAAVDLDGTVAWTNRDHPFHGVHGCGASPLLYQDMLIFPFGTTSPGPGHKVGHTVPWDESYILALDKTCGKERWRAGRGPSRVAHVTPQVITSYGGDQLISAAGDAVQGTDPLTGKLFWTLTYSGEGVVPSVVVGGGLVFVASGFGAPALHAVRPGGRDGSPAAVVWEVRKAVPMVPSFVYLNDRLYAITEAGVAQCLDARTGRALWQERLPGSYFASPVAAEGRIYFLSESGESVVVEAADTFRTLARNPLAGPCRASVAVSDRHLFIRTKDHLVCIGPPTGGR
jgi:outer membrane protein assembly factor BamB